MKKIFRTILLIVLSTIIFIITVFVIGRYGWRLFGFSMCSGTVFCTDVSVDDGVVALKGSTADSISSYVGYKYKIEDGNLYIGVKYNILIGIIGRDGAFDIKINTEEEFDHIYFVSRDGVIEPPIWSREDSNQ
ncbi:MAG: hypothetical protein K0S47_1268 [Herbinix sp.]|jgi:hypothetical protein|nr:hypothetical protein [Herbinix sp.]